MKSGPLQPGRSLAQLANNEQPPVDLESFLARLRAAGITEVYLASETPSGALIEASTVEAARSGRAVIMAKGRRIVASEQIGWGAPLRDMLEQLAKLVQGFDKITRFRLAASDMRLAAHAAAALVDASESNGPARLFDRVIETGMVVTYMRPFLESNEAGLGKSWRPRDPADRELHEELDDLRNEYHAHAAHTPRRRLENTTTMFGDEGRPRFAESWEHIPSWKLRAIEDLATRQADRFDDEAARLDVELFGSLNDD